MIVPASEENLDRAAQLLRGGKLVAFPTETVYGLGANALDTGAVSQIYQAKQRPFASPLIVHVAQKCMARSLTAEWPATAESLAAKFWPGPLTMVLKKAAVVPDLVTAGLDSVGVRIPSHPVALELIRRAGVPIAAPSANLFGQISPTTPNHVWKSLGERVDLILDGGPTQIGIESTVVSLHRNPPVVLRPGMISLAELEHVTGKKWEVEVDRPHIAESPGLYPKHYAPRTPFFVLGANSAEPKGRGRILKMPSDRNEYAASLYSELHKADSEGWDWIGVEEPPETPDWAGIRDRLQRAAGTG